jgi:prepilin-type N-terminal cleavage/methylation domain-containing protein
MAPGRKRQRGFTFLELAIAVVILLVGIWRWFSVPTALKSNNATGGTPSHGHRATHGRQVLRPLSARRSRIRTEIPSTLGASLRRTVVGGPLISGKAAISSPARSPVTTRQRIQTTRAAPPRCSLDGNNDHEWYPHGRVSLWVCGRPGFNQPVNIDTTRKNGEIENIATQIVKTKKCWIYAARLMVATTLFVVMPAWSLPFSLPHRSATVGEEYMGAFSLTSPLTRSLATFRRGLPVKLIYNTSVKWLATPMVGLPVASAAPCDLILESK